MVVKKKPTVIEKKIPKKVLTPKQKAEKSKDNLRPKKEFKVISFGDSSLSSKFGSLNIETTLNDYGLKGWTVKTSFIGNSTTLMSGRNKETVYFILERDK